VPYFPLGGFSPCSPRPSRPSPSGSAPPRWRSRSPGCCSGRRTSC
jgi:hypothetical protein